MSYFNPWQSHPVKSAAVSHDSLRSIAVVGVVVRDGRLLVIRRSQSVRAPGAICFPGGAIEPGESEEAALLRETQEEVGLAVSPVRRLHVSITSWQVEIRWWLAAADEFRFVLHPGEVESIHWHTPAELLAMEGVLESNLAFLAAWQEGAFEIDGLDRKEIGL
jgi:8-oxo-dGTP diphosphatase